MLTYSYKFLAKVANILNTVSKLTIDEVKGYIKNIVSGQSVSEILSNFTDTDNVRIVDKNGDAIAADGNVGTGSKIRMVDGDGNVVDEVTVIVKGDVNGDGEIMSIDYLRIKGSLLGTYSCEGAYFEAAREVNESSDELGTITYIRVKSHILGTYDLYATK